MDTRKYLNIIPRRKLCDNQASLIDFISSTFRTCRFHTTFADTFVVRIVRLLREELGLLQQPGSYVGEVVKVMGSKRVLVKVHPEGKYGTAAQSTALEWYLRNE